MNPNMEIIFKMTSIKEYLNKPTEQKILVEKDWKHIR
jgi:hypothetical protein